MTADSSRQSAALVASLALHAAVAALLLARGAAKLTLEPSPLVLTLVEASTQTAGPGERSPQLRESAPALLAAPAVAEAAVPAKPLEPEPVEAVPVPAPKPVPRKPATAKPLPPVARRAPAATSPVASAPSAPSPGGVDGGTGEGGRGDAARATAPAWAPTARVRYEELLFAWMNRHKEYPMLAQRRGIQGRGSVRVRIDREGRVLERALVASTGQGLLDEAALDMVRRASPFPAVPDGYSGSTFEFVAPVEYRLR